MTQFINDVIFPAMMVGPFVILIGWLSYGMVKDSIHMMNNPPWDNNNE